MWGEVGGYGVDSASVALSVTVRDISNWSLFKLIISDQTLIKLT